VVASTPKPSVDELPIPLIVGATLGGVAFLLLVLAIYCKCCRGESEKPAAPAAARAQPTGIQKEQARADRNLPAAAPKPTQDRSLEDVPKPLEPTPAMTFSTRYAPEVPPPEEEAPVLQVESPRHAERSSPPVTPSAPIDSAEISLQV